MSSSASLSDLVATLGADLGEAAVSGTDGDSSKLQPTISTLKVVEGYTRKVYVAWKWSKKKTDHYKVRYDQRIGDVWDTSGSTTSTQKHIIIDANTDATKIRVKVLPIAKDVAVKDSNGKKTGTKRAWNGDYCPFKTLTFATETTLSTPSAPTIELNNYNLTVRLDNYDNLNESDENVATCVCFEIVQDDTSVIKDVGVTLTFNCASYSCTVSSGHSYKARCYAYHGTTQTVEGDRVISGSEWSSFSSSVSTRPAEVLSFTSLYAQSETSIYVAWATVSGATSYELAYTGSEYGFAAVQEIQTITTEEHYLSVTGLESGKKYQFRVRAINDNGNSEWTTSDDLIAVGSAPDAPTTWSESSTVSVGDIIKLYWLHNSADGSNEQAVTVAITVNDVTTYYDFDTGNSVSGVTQSSPGWQMGSDGQAGVFMIDSTNYDDSTEVYWQVSTKGVIDTYSAYSTRRKVTVYAPPSLSLSVPSALSSFPLTITANPAPLTQTPIGYSLTITSTTDYETVDETGEDKTITTGEEIYTQYIDSSQESLSLAISAGDIYLCQNCSYKVSCTVAMNSGLTASAEAYFSVSWTETDYYSNAEFIIDEDAIGVWIKPYCVENGYSFEIVTKDDDTYLRTGELLDIGSISNIANTGDYIEDTNNKPVFSGTINDSESVYFCVVAGEEIQVSNVTLAVYRRDFDGGFTEIASDISGSNDSWVYDPHPSLNFARYRIVATDVSTGSISYTDLPGLNLDKPYVIMQWEEEWDEYDVPIQYPEYTLGASSSMIKFLYNIDTSENSSPDVSLVEYIGRKHPVSYYGTQLGDKATWNVEFEKTDIETIYAVRRLSRWLGNVYVREPSGAGYWANVTVSFNNKHSELAIPVTFTITRVEGEK